MGIQTQVHESPWLVWHGKARTALAADRLARHGPGQASAADSAFHMCNMQQASLCLACCWPSVVDQAGLKQGVGISDCTYICDISTTSIDA